MALGDVTTISPDVFAIEALASATATNAAPTGTAGIAANDIHLFGIPPRKMRAAVVSTAGSGTMTATIKVWGRIGSIGWVVLKSINGGSAIAETGTDTIGFSEEFDTGDVFDRYYIEVAGIAGSSTAVTGYLVVARPY